MQTARVARTSNHIQQRLLSSAEMFESDRNGSSISFPDLSFCPSTGFPPFYFSSSFPLFFPLPPAPSGFPSVSLWSSHSRRRLDQPLTSCLRPAWTSAPPVTQNATRRLLVQATGTCDVFWPMRHSTRMGSLLRQLLRSMATTPTRVRPILLGLLGRPSGHMSGGSDRSLAMMGVLAFLGRTTC